MNLREFSEEASGIIFWTGVLLGLIAGLMVSAAVLLYFFAMAAI